MSSVLSPLRRWNLLSWLLPLIVFLLAAPGVLRYGLTWDEPTYVHFARMQREWVGRLIEDAAHPDRIPALFTPEAISRTWLQDRDKNGHPPLNEVWMGLAGLPFHWAGMPDLQAFRLAVALLLGLTTMLLYRLMRQSLSRRASLAGVLAFLGIPAVWAHGHIAATETMQLFFWVLLAFLLPSTLKRGGARLWLWLLACALSFMAKFTNLLIPIWVLGTAAILGAWRSRRFWISALLALVVAPALLMLLDPFFWPWQDGLARFADYLGQTTTRGHWLPIKVFYLGQNWGFRPPWHYRLVQTLAVLPVPLILLFVPGLYFAAVRVRVELKNQIRSGTLFGLRRKQAAAEADAPALRHWPEVLGISGFLFALVVGWLPNSPNHDSTRQFVYIFVAISLLAGTSAEGILGWARARGFISGARDLRESAWAGTLLCVAAASFAISLSHEPWGLSYYSEWIGGARGAWARGFELSYWSETITTRMLEKLARIQPREGPCPVVHTLPKLNYFSEGEDCLRALVPANLARRAPLARDVTSAFYMPWSAPFRRGNYGAVLGLSFPQAPDAIIVCYRRATVNAGLWDFLDELARRNELIVLDETVVGGVVLARLYQVPEVVPGKIRQDPEDRVWYQLPAIAAEAPRLAP